MRKSFFLVVILMSGSIFSQQEEVLKTEKITIIKPYTPEVINTQKENIVPPKTTDSPKIKLNYNLLKLPNTYIHNPKKILPLEMDFITNKRDTNNVNYTGDFIMGIANYWTIYGEFFLSDSIDSKKSFGMNAKYFNVSGKNSDSKYNMNFRDAFIKFFYNQYFDDYYLKSNIDYYENEISYYGIPSYIDKIPNSSLHPADIDITNNFKTLYLKNYFSRYQKDTSSLFFLNSANLNINYLEDAYYTNEFNVNLKTSARISIEDLSLGTDIHFENQYLTTSIKDTITSLNTGNFILNPYLIYELEGFILTLGANLYYNYNKQKNNIKVYPKFNLEYSPGSNIFTVFSTLEGGYKLNTYTRISNINPWITPLDIDNSPLDIIYDFSLGIKGTLLENISYKTGISYSQINNNLNFKPNINFNSNQISKFPNIGYVMDNSFETIRINTTLLELFFKSDYKFSKNKEIGIKASFFISEADSLKFYYQPNLDIEAYANFFFYDKWQANIFAKYIGKRNSLTPQSNGIKELINTSLDGFIDVNINISYSFSDEFSLFTKLNNVINRKYQLYNNYNSMGIWIMFGVSYKF